MPTSTIPSIEVFEDEWVTTVSHYVTSDGTALLQGDVTATTGISLTVFDVSQGSGDANTALATVALDPANLIFDVLQDDGYWDRPYNFRHTYDWTVDANGGAALTTTGGMRMRLQYTLAASNGTPQFGSLNIVRDVRFKPRL